MSPSPAPVVGDHLALDFINTRFGVDAAERDILSTDADVLDWLARTGLPADPAGLAIEEGALVSAAVALRETARDLVEHRKAGTRGDPASLNAVLASAQAHQALEWKKGEPPRRVLERVSDRPEALLVPVAESLAQLLAEGDFALVRCCESPDCTLWFYDRTRSHRRRWCSAADCGNRAKVAAFRARKRAEA